MPRYVDGFLLVVPKKNMAAYRRMAKTGCKVWKDHGALDYVECVGNDLASPCGVPFDKLMKAGKSGKKAEVVVFSYIVYKSKAHRDRVNAKVMEDPRINEMLGGKPMPFDMNRMSMGGFEAFVEA